VDLKRLADPFRPDDIDWRIGQAGKKQSGEVWARVLAYITNRAIMERLDEVVGSGNWRNEEPRIIHFPNDKGETVTGVLCGLSLKLDGEWVTKWDGAEPTDIEPVKGGLSGSMKRAGVLWGIGRYLYDLPEGWAKIVEKGTKGATYSKVNVGKKNAPEWVDIYWLPPALPRWAQPTEREEEVGPAAVPSSDMAGKSEQPPLALVTDTPKPLAEIAPTLAKNIQTWVRNKQKDGTSEEDILAELKRRGLVA
jgi:hypothetical protein